MRRKLAVSSVVAMIAAILPLALPSLVEPAAAAGAAGDGTTSGTAGASCWGIKQQYPSSADGVYWLQTPALEKPQQFYCDMTTDGGGWVMVGRGRQGWSFAYDGQGAPSSIRNTPTGTGAFAPAALGTDTVNALANGAAFSSQPDGIRIRRAANTTGTAWQEQRWRPADLQSWTWAFGGGVRLSSMTVDGQTYSPSNTRDTNLGTWAGLSQQTTGNNSRRTITYPFSTHNYVEGFSYGATVDNGSNNSTNYLWERANENYAIPFTQVYIRPRIANGSFSYAPIPAGGYPEQTLPFELKERAEVNPWGVTGVDHTDEPTTEPWKMSVLTVKVFGNTVYVGGRFTSVQQGPGGPTTAQPFLAAFDRTTGNWISTFRPALNGRVWDIVQAPDGKLIIGGDFTTVNGNATPGLAALNAATGASITTWKANVTREDSSGLRAVVRALDIQDGYLYAGGRFNRLTAGTWNKITVPNTLKVNLTNGNPVSTWKATVAATVVDLDATADRVWLTGYFNAINSDTTQGYAGAVNTTNGAVVPGVGPFQPSRTTSTSAKYQQAVLDLGDKVVIGGAEHDLQLYDRNRSALLQSHITRQGGDFQAVALLNGDLYGGCHCGDYDYQGTNLYQNMIGFTEVNPINFIGRYDAASLEHEASWNPDTLKSASGEGPWALTPDQDSCLWFGGDFNLTGGGSNAAANYIGNFGRFCPEDSVAPTRPTNLQVNVDAAGANLTWTRSTDATTIEYWIYRDGRVVGTSFGNTYTDADFPGSGQYVVRAVDVRGNKSATLAPLTISPAPPPPVQTELIAFKSDWKWNYPSAAIAADWATEGFDDSTWAVGPAEFGFNDNDEATNIRLGPPPQPRTAYFRTTVDIANPAAFSSVLAEVVRDDGAAVYVNGVEIGRDNLPAGTLTWETDALVNLETRAQELANATFTIPASAFHAGTNTIAVEVHNYTRWSGDMSFDLRLTGQV